MTAGPPASSAPRAGSLEWLADQQPDAVAIVDTATGRILTRAAHDRAAGALADALAAEHAVTAGARVGLRLGAGPDLLVATYALAKLGAAPVVFDARRPPGEARRLAVTAGCALLISDEAPAAATDGVPLLPASALGPLTDRHAGGARRLSGEQPAPDGVQVAPDPGGTPVPVLRGRAPDRVARLGATVGDLLGRVGLPTGTVHLLGPAAAEAEPLFWASVALLTAGGVVTLAEPGPAALLATLAGHGVVSTVLSPAELRALTELPASLTDEADLTALQRVLVVGPVDPGLTTAADDLLGEDVVQQVLATPQTGPFAHAGGDFGAGARPLSGVTVTTGTGSELLVTSPLAADGALGDLAGHSGWPAPPAWSGVPVPTGLTGALTPAGLVTLG